MTGEQITNSDEVKEFVKKLSDKTDTELSAVITRYISYRPETVEAALFVSVEKGFISYDIKELLWQQIESSFKAQKNNIKYYKWETGNAFIKYFSGYQDEAIYNIIEDPDNIAIDVYHALLVTAKERELISEADFKKYLDDARQAILSDEEINRRVISDVFRIEESTDDYQDEAELEAEREKYWKCPKCNENVGMELAVCWNCEALVPEIIVHPDPVEIRKELPPKMPVTPFNIGIRLVGTGIIVFVIDLFRHYHHSSYLATHLGGYIISGFFVLLGLGFIIYGAFNVKKDS